MSLLIFPVVESSAFTVLRKAIITETKSFTENQNEVPDGKAFHCDPAMERQWSLLFRNPSVCTCYFFPDDCAKSLPLATLNPVFAEKAQSFQDVFIWFFHYFQQSAFPFDLLLDTVC